jgi:hypothetical protein
MKEEVLINLGFERNDVSEEESGDKAFYYFTMDFGDLCLISNANDESEKDGGYFVEVFDNMDIRIEDETDLKNLIEIFKRSLKDGQVS